MYAKLKNIQNFVLWFYTVYSCYCLYCIIREVKIFYAFYVEWSLTTKAFSPSTAMWSKMSTDGSKFSSLRPKAWERSTRSYKMTTRSSETFAVSLTMIGNEVENWLESGKGLVATQQAWCTVKWLHTRRSCSSWKSVRQSCCQITWSWRNCACFWTMNAARWVVRWQNSWESFNWMDLAAGFENIIIMS